MKAISTYSNNLFSKESALNFAGTVGAGLLSSRFLPISIKEAGVVSAAAGTLSTMGQALVGKDASPFKKSLLTIGAFALTYFSTAALAPTLAARFAITLTPQVIGKVLAFNALGQVVSFGIAKVLFVTSWNRSDDQIKTLHETYTSDKELFTKLPAIEQQLVVHRFKKLELDVTPFTCEKPSDKDIAALSASEVRTLHQHEVVLEDDALLLRYFELDLSPFEVIKTRIPKVELKQPETVEEVQGLSEEKCAWYKLYFANNTSARCKLPYDVQWALYEKDKVVSTYSFNSSSLKTAPDAQILDLMDKPSLSWWVNTHLEAQNALAERAKALGIEIPYPVHPTTPDEVAKLDNEVVKAYNKKFPDGLDQEVVKAFHQRFYEMKLPLPNGLTIRKLNNDNKLKWPDISLTLPVTAKEVQELDNNQLPWLYVSIRQRGGFSDLSFELQSDLNVRFNEVLSWRYWFSFEKLTVDNVTAASKQTIEILHDQLYKKPEDWQKLPADVIGALDARFAEQYWFSFEKLAVDNVTAASKRTIEILHDQLHKKPQDWQKLSADVIGALDARFAEQFPTDKLSEKEARAYHILFVTKPECWNALAKARQQALRQAFDKYPELQQLKVKLW